eukprot:1161071-Pelagomonas_calceolata.AAC.13
MAVLDVQFMNLPGWRCATPDLSLPLILRSTQCEGKHRNLTHTLSRKERNMKKKTVQTEKLSIRQLRKRRHVGSKEPEATPPPYILSRILL